MKKNYSDKLKSPKWQRKRLEILNIHNFKCDNCLSEDDTLNVHHRFYLKGREPWQYDNDVFMVLCEKCHKKEHEPKEELKEVIPDEYKKIVEHLNKIKNKDLQCVDSLEFILEQISLNDTYSEFFINYLSNAFNGGAIDKIYHDLWISNSIESLEVNLWSQVNELKNIIKLYHPNMEEDYSKYINSKHKDGFKTT